MIQLGPLYIEDPWYLVLLPMLWASFYWYYKQKKASHVITVPTLNTETISNIWTKLYPYLWVLPLLTLSLLLFALARPRTLDHSQRDTAEGIDIALALDLSKSMLAQDFSPNRLEASKRVAANFVKGRMNDRFCLIPFSGEAFTLSPLTTDHQLIQDLISQLQTGMIEDGTAIGLGIATAANRLKDSDASSKVIILMTDGQNTAGYIKPEIAAELAKELGIRIYAIGIGTKGVVPVPMVDIFGRESMTYSEVNIDEELLTYVSSLTGGKYYRAVDASTLERVYEEIDKLEKTIIETQVKLKYYDLYRQIVLVGLGLLLLYFIIRFLIIKSFP